MRSTLALSDPGVGTAYNGTATIQAGSISFNNVAAVGTSSSFNMTGGELLMNVGGSGSNSATLGNLSGASGDITSSASGVNTQSNRFTFTQTVANSYGGAISGNSTVGGVATLGITKAGAATVTLNGSGVVDIRETLQVSAGTLLINKSITAQATTATVGLDTTAVVVNSGATLGGSGTITSGKRSPPEQATTT